VPGRLVDAPAQRVRLPEHAARQNVTIEGQWSTAGTANLDRLSAVGNYEINVELYSEALARQMEDQFERDVTCAKELHWEEWVRRPWYAKLGEVILAPPRNLLQPAPATFPNMAFSPMYSKCCQTSERAASRKQCDPKAAEYHSLVAEMGHGKLTVPLHRSELPEMQPGRPDGGA
jgi:hypothetical protein